MTSPIRAVLPLGFPWQTPDPFLFCVYHDDRYPAGKPDMTPNASLAGRHMGQDFEGKDGWRMYHGSKTPGFPQHPHRGFETVTIVRQGLIDHSDSLGASARFGNGDVQWLTAGRGINHSEMFPLLNTEAENPLELFQIWLNLPRADKMAEPHFAMLWGKNIPRDERDGVQVSIIAGALDAHRALAPPPKSWASRADADVAIWTLKLAPGAKWTLPPAKKGTNRFLYFFKGKTLAVAGETIPVSRALVLEADVPAAIENGQEPAELLMLQGRPIGEPVVQHGPFVMTTEAELRQTFLDYQRTHFGGWKWASDEPVHPREQARFARHADGHTENP
ncbi:MAG: pirin family protein [Deltaproteobacteria bacterium]|nr:pirin family protein [Deltaproteobacteria bacterium]